MKAGVAVLFVASIVLIHSQECNGKLSDDARIQMSLIRIQFEGDTIQTAAYSTMCGEIFTLNTEDIRKGTIPMENNRQIPIVYGKPIRHDLKAYNTMGENIYIFAKRDDGEVMTHLWIHHDFTGSASGEQIIRPEPLPFGEEDDDNVAQLAGWGWASRHIVIPVMIEKNQDRTYIHVNLKAFIEERKANYIKYDMREGDLLIQSNKIIGFLRNIDTDEGVLVFYRAVSIISTSRNRFVNKK